MKEAVVDSQPESTFPPLDRVLHRISISVRPKSFKKASQFKGTTTQQQHVVVRKRKLTVPLYIFDNPFFTSTDVVVSARYTNLQHIGSGRFGAVVRAIDSKTGNRVAIKKIFSAFIDTHSTRRVLRELRLLRYLNHPHIVRLVDVDYPSNYRTWDSVYLLTSLLNCDLRTALLGGRLNDPNLQRRVLAQLCLALEHMHSHGVMHRDVKSSNVLLDDTLNVQICDLGSARYSSKTSEKVACENDLDIHDEAELTLGARTPLQSAPELFLNESYDSKVDMWGIGCIAAEFLHRTHGHIFHDLEIRNPLKEVVQVLGYPTESQMAHLTRPSSKWYMRRLKTNQPGSLRERVSSDDESAVDFVSKLLRFAPHERMSATEALRHPFIAQVAMKERKRINAHMKTSSEPVQKMSRSALKDLVWKEVAELHPEAAAFR